MLEVRKQSEESAAGRVHPSLGAVPHSASQTYFFEVHFRARPLSSPCQPHVSLREAQRNIHQVCNDWGDDQQNCGGPGRSRITVTYSFLWHLMWMDMGLGTHLCSCKAWGSQLCWTRGFQASHQSLGQIWRTVPSKPRDQNSVYGCVGIRGMDMWKPNSQGKHVSLFGRGHRGPNKQRRQTIQWAKGTELPCLYLPFGIWNWTWPSRNVGMEYVGLLPSGLNFHDPHLFSSSAGSSAWRQHLRPLPGALCASPGH